MGPQDTHQPTAGVCATLPFPQTVSNAEWWCSKTPGVGFGETLLEVDLAQEDGLEPRGPRAEASQP